MPTLRTSRGPFPFGRVTPLTIPPTRVPSDRRLLSRTSVAARTPRGGIACRYPPQIGVVKPLIGALRIILTNYIRIPRDPGHPDLQTSTTLWTARCMVHRHQNPSHTLLFIPIVTRPRPPTQGFSIAFLSPIRRRLFVSSMTPATNNAPGRWWQARDRVDTPSAREKGSRAWRLDRPRISCDDPR